MRDGQKWSSGHAVKNYKFSEMLFGIMTDSVIVISLVLYMVYCL